MTDNDVDKVYNLYGDYKDVIEKVKVVTIPEVKDKGYSLAINNYIERKEQEITPPAEVRKQYFDALEKND